MDFIVLFKALILGVVEGLTEFLPISSTGHLILVGDLIHFKDDGDVFKIVIQFGAILAVCWEFRARIISTFSGLFSDSIAQKFTLNLIVAFLPFAILAQFFYKAIKAVLFKPVPVALAFIIGGFIILFAEHWYKKRLQNTDVVLIDSVDAMTWKDALRFGIAQCAALIPGTSRSGATIIGGLFFGFSRKCATEFTFFLAMPTLFGATVYSLWGARNALSGEDLPAFTVGFVAAFASAFVVVRWLIRYISTHDFTVFAWYRIAFGLVILATAHFGIVDWSAA